MTVLSLFLKTKLPHQNLKHLNFAIYDGIMDYVKELAGDNAFTTPQYWECEEKG